MSKNYGQETEGNAVQPGNKKKGAKFEFQNYDKERPVAGMRSKLSDAGDKFSGSLPELLARPRRFAKNRLASRSRSGSDISHRSRGVPTNKISLPCREAGCAGR